MSSGNNARLVAAGKRFRGGPGEAVTESHQRGTPPIGPLGSDTTGARWCGHAWSEWMTMDTNALQTLALGYGLYRIQGNDKRLVYIGEGAIRSRLRAHLAKLNAPTPHGTALRAAAPLTFSAVANSTWRRHQRLELETDLIGAYVLATHQLPAAQFIG